MERTINFAKLEGAKGAERKGRYSDQLIGSDPALGKGQSWVGVAPICGHVRTEGWMMPLKHPIPLTRDAPKGYITHCFARRARRTDGAAAWRIVTC